MQQLYSTDELSFNLKNPFAGAKRSFKGYLILALVILGGLSRIYAKAYMYMKSLNVKSMESIS